MLRVRSAPAVAARVEPVACGKRVCDERDRLLYAREEGGVIDERPLHGA